MGTGAVNILSLCGVARLQRKMNIQGKMMVKGKGSAELFVDPEKPSSSDERDCFGEGGSACMWDEMRAVSAALAQADSRGISSQKTVRKRSETWDPTAPASFHTTAYRAHAGGCLPSAREQWTTRLGCALLYIPHTPLYSML